MSIQGLRENIRQTSGINRHINNTKANILCVPLLHVENRHNSGENENCGR